MNNTFGLGPLDRLEQELGLGQPLQNANRGIAADQGSEYQLPDVDIGQQPRQQGQQSSATYQQQQVDTRQPQQPMMNGSSGLLPPQPLVSAFESASTKHDVPVNVLMALAQQESSYNANAKGPQTKWGNAKGMMQYLDSTAKMMGINPYDPIQSIDAAAKQIRQRLDKGYSMEDAVKEHFAGPNRNLWGAKTKQYGIDVMGKAARIADEMYGHLRPENLQAQEALDTAFAEQEARLSEPVNLSNSVYENILQIGLPSGDELVDGDRLHLVGRTRFERDIANGWQNLAKIAPNDDLGKRLQEQSNYLQEEAKKNLSRTEQLTLRNDMALFERELSAYNQTVDNYNNGLERLQELDKQFDETYNQQEIRPREVTWYEKIGNWLPQGSYASNAFKNIPKGWRNAKAEATISDVLAEGREGETDDTMPYFQRLKGGAAEGFNNMVDALGTTKFILAGGDSDQMAEALSTKMTEQAEREKRRSAGDLQIRSTFGAVSDAEGGSEIIGSSIYALGSILRNAEDFGITIAEQAGNMIPTMAGGLGGAATGAAGGAAVGGLPGASAGAIYGGSAGMMAGTTAIEVGFETEEMIMNRLSENGLPPTKENIKAILDDPEFISEAREQGLKKGITLAAVDQLFMAIGGAVASRPFRQAGQQALTEIPKPKFRTKVKAGFQGFGIDVVGEGAAEAASQHVARGEIDAGDVLLETAAGFGSSMITTPVAAGAAILNDRVKNRGQAGVPPIPIDSNTRQPIDEIVEEVPEQPSGPTSRAARAGELAAGQQLSEEQTAADSRVVVSSPTANISGFLDDYQEDGEGGFTARVLGDDGTTYQFTQNDPINIVPEAQFLAEQEALAEQVASGNIDPETGEVLTTDETSSESLLVDEEVPTTSIQTEPTTEESQESVALVDESESLTDEQKLVRSLAYFTEQARINGGWNELLSVGRDNAQAGLSVIPPSEVIPLATDVTTPNGNPLVEVFYPAIGKNVLVREDQWNNRNNLNDGLPYFDHQGRRGRLHSIKPEEIAGLRNSTSQTVEPVDVPQEQAPEVVDVVVETTEPVSTMDVEDVEFIESQTPSMDFEQEALAASEPVTSQVGVSTTDTQEQVIGDVLVDEAIEPVIEATEASEPSSIEQQAAAQAERTKDRTERIKSATSLDEWRDIINEQSADPSPTGSNPNEFVQASKRAYDRLNGQLEKRRNRAIEEIEQEGNIKWFGSEEKAQEYLDKNGLNELYDANQKPVYGVRRFVIERKGVDYPSEYSEEQLENDVNAAQTWDNAEVDLKQEIIRRGKVGKTNQELTFNQLPRKVQERVIGAIARIESEQPTEVSAESVELPTEVAELPTEVTELATEVVEEVSTPSPDSDLFANNTLFTSDAVEKARARLRSKLRNANSGIDPEVLVDGMTIAGAYIEAGVRNFTDYANRMVSDLGDDIKPYLLSFWEGARNYPNLNTENMTSVDDSYKLHQEILNPQDLNNPAIGEINEISDTESGSTSATTNTSATRASGSPRAAKKAAPKRAKTQKALRRDGRLKQDYGVTHIDGFSDNNSGRETGSATKDAFLKDTKRYLDGVKDQLEELGYTPYTNDKGKNITPVSINEGGDAVSGEVTLNMQGPNGVGAYIVVGDSALRGTVPTTASGVSIMMRTNDASDIYRGHANRWVSTELTGAELANLADGYVKLKEAANEQSNERVQAPNRVGVSAVDTGRADNAQQAPTQGDIGNVEVTESENVPQVTEPTDGEEVSLRPATEDVAEEGRASASRLSDDGRTRASGSGISDARARESERADVTRQRDSDSVKDPKTVSPSNQGAGDLVIADPMAIVGGGQEARFSKNQEAIELRNTLIDEARNPTKEEQEVLAGYTGWGSFGQELFQGSWNNPQPKKGWESRDKWLRDNLGQAEWEGMQRSIINAHYTDPPTVMAMWDMMKRMGFDGGRVLEPSIGIGNFFGMMPRELSSRSQRTGIELDPVTGSMAQMIYPKSNIQIMGYEKSNTPDNFYDVVIGNWPFANISPADRRYNRFSPMLHDYFFLKALDQTRPGGIVMGITSKGTMDKVDSRVRYELAKKGELVAAFRLPSGAFQGYAGTSVVTDIIILRKRTEPESVVTNDGWIKSVPYKTPSGPEVNLNEYYVANPSHVLGTIDAGRGMYRQDEMIVNRPDNLMERLRKAVDSVPEGAYHTDTRGESISYIANHTDDRTNALIQQDGQFYVVQGEHLLNANDDVLKYKVKSDKTTADREAQFSKLINMRKLYGELIELERGNSDAEPKRKELKDVYEAFKSEHGNYSESYGLNYLSKIDDPFYPALAALENTQEVNGETVYNPAAILTESTIRSKVRLENPSIIDAFVLARNDSVNPSPERVAELSGASVDDVKRELVESGAAFEEPGGDLVPSDIYLSGNIRQKLRQAQAGLENGNEAMRRNIEALEAVMPEDIPYYKIETQLGATWIPTTTYEEFVAHMLGLSDASDIKATFIGGSWKIDFPSNLNHRTEAKTGFGTPRYDFKKLVNAAISNQSINIRVKDEDGSTFIDQEATNEVNARIAEMRQRFAEWLWSDPNRQVDLEFEYNESRNPYATPKFDGSFLGFEGMSLTLGDGPFNLREHQVNAIWRALVTKKSLNAHEVGTGKAQPLDAKILTPTGWKLMGDIKVGDLVITQSGKATIVEAVFPQGKKDIYRVGFSDGSKTESCLEHLWKVNQNKIVSLSEIKDNLGYKSHFIPLVKAIELEERELPIDPYLLGASLVDGIFNGYAKNISTTDDVNNYLNSLGINNKLSKDKFIPDDYLFNSLSNRISLLQGIMDADSHISIGGDISLYTVSERFSKDVVSLIQSLGGVASLKIKKASYTNQDGYKEYGDLYSIYIKVPKDIKPFRSDVKSKIFNKKNFNLVRYITEVTFVGQKEAQCIRVADNSHLYITDDFIVTHNTFTMGGIAVESRRYGIAKKPLLFAHNANSRSVANEIQMMYPASKILYVDNLSSKNIKTRMMQIANDDWDVVVFPHSLIDRIGFKEETLMEMAQQQLDELEQAAKEAAIDDGTDISDDMLTDPDELKKLRSVTAKELVKQRLNILETIKKLSQQSSRENAIAFEDLGVDMVLVDECFSYDTLIETDLGFMPIGYIVENKIEVKVKSMDSYTHEVQWKPVINWFKNRRKKELIEVFHEKGSFVCTPEHKIWVQGQGYKEAGKLLPSDKLIVRNGGYSEASKEGANYNDLRMVQDGNFLSKEQAKEVLQRILQDASSTQQSRFTPEVEEFHGENMEKLTTQRESQSICIRNDEKQQPYVERGIKKKSVGNPQKDWSSTKHKGWEWETHKATNIACRKDRLCDGACCFDKADKTSNGKASELIQDRFSMRRIENSDRDRWAESQLNEDENIGCKERESFISSGLVGIAVLKQDSDGEYRFGGREHTFVYDIEVEENHNYFANGVLVSNCHEFKKPPISTKMKIKGLQTQTSNKSIAMSFITKYVRSMNNGGNVHLFTGTPITNTMTEIYHMQRYLMQEEMEEAGLSDWDGWFGSFARETEDVELTSTGEYEKITRLQSFINVPELRRMIGQYMDVVFSDDMPEMQPRVVDGKQLNDPDLTESEQAAILNGRTEGARDRPYKRIVNESSDMSAEQNVVFSRVQQWANTWRNMSGKDRKEAMAKGSPEVPIIYDGVAERASFDVRLVNGIENAGKEGSEEMTPHPQSKPARVVKNLIDIYNSDERATQVVFMEQGMSDVVTRSEGEPGNKQQVRYKSFSTLKDMIERLVQQGIPRERIATVTGSTSKEKRAEIADMMNRGEIRIVFGSTQSLGVGVNMQRNLRAMHHMDAPWMPGDLEQRNGRGHRQGNQWNTVLEYRYLTDRLDGRRWQVLAIKQRFINDFMRSKGNERVIDGDAVGDEQGDILSTFSEAAGDPRILVREKLKGKIDGLKSRERMNNRAKADGRNQLGRLKNEVQRDNERLQELKRSGAIKKVSDLINNQLGDKFKATIFGQSFNSSTAARDFVRDKMASNIRLGEDKQIGTYGNVPLHAYWNQFRGEPNLYIDIGNETIESNGPSLPSLASALRDFRDNEESNLVKGINDKMATIERLENVINEPFHMANELARAEKQLDNLETDLSLNPFAPPYWLRSGAPVDTNVMWQGKEFLVTGHRWNNDGYFVLAEDDSGAVAIPYLEAKDGQGMQVYEEQAFEAPKVVTNDKESDKVDMSVISNPLAHIDADSINDRLRTGELGNVMGRLLDSGQVTIHATTDSLPDNVVSNGLAIQGYTERATGNIHLIAENLTVDSALPVVMHELVHANGKSLLGENRWKNLMARGQAYLNSAMIRKSEGTVNPESFWDRALNRVETAKAEGLIQDGREAEEFLAYTLEEYQRAPDGIKKWASNLVGVVKDWLSRNFNIQLGSVTPGQLRALAINAAKQSRSRQPDIPNSDISYSVNGRRVLPTSTNIRTDDGQPLVRFFYSSEGIHVLIREDDWYSGADELPTYNYKGEPTAGLQTINRSRLVTALRRPDDPFRDAEEAAEMEFYELSEIPDSAYVNNNSNIPTPDDIDAYFEGLEPEDMEFSQREEALEESKAAQDREPKVKPTDIVKEDGKPLNNKEKEQFLDDATEFLEREDLSEPQSMVRGDFIGQATKDMVGARSLYTKFMVHPYQVASLYPEFTPVFDVSTRQNQTRNKIIEDLHQDYVLYQQLSQKSKANVNKALELGRLTYQAWSKEEVKAGVNNRGFNYTVEMDDQGKPKRVRKDFSAQLSKSGDTIKLNDAEADAYVALRNMFDRALDMFRDQMLEEMGLGWLNTHEGEGRPLVLRELEDGRIVLKGTVYDAETKKALDEAVSPVEIRNILANHPILSVVKNVTKGIYSKEHGGYVYPAAKRGQLESELDNFLGLSIEEQILSLKKEGMTPERLEFYDNVARAVGDIEQSKRTGYVPFTRYGDYVIAVKERIHDIKYRTSDTGEIYATDVPDSLNDFLDDIGAEYDHVIGGWLLSERQQDRLERENENTIYSEKVETGLRDMFGNNSERNVKMRKGKVTDIKSVKDAMARIERDYIVGHENRRITSFETAKKNTSGEVDFTGIDVLAETAMIDTATWEAVRNQLVKAMGSKGFRSHFFQSSNVPGYSPDFERSIADYIVGLSGYLARRRHSAEWDNAISNVQGEKLHKYATSYRNYSNEPSEEYALLRQTGFFMYIAGNISSAFLNATQVALITMPMLSMVSNSARATAEAARAYKDAIAMVRANKTTGFDIFDFTKAPDDVRSSLIKAGQEGLLLPLQALEIMGVAGRRSVKGRQAQRRYDTAVQTLALPFTFAERLNRIVTFIAAHRIASKDGYNANIRRIFRNNPQAQMMMAKEGYSPYSFAEFVVDETQFRMGKANRPTAMRNVGAAIFQFKSFMLQFFEALYRNGTIHGKEGKKAVAATLAMMVALSGLWGLPGAEDLMELFEGMYRHITKRDKDLRTDLRKFVFETTNSNYLAALVDGGFPYAGGVDMRGRIGMGQIMPETQSPTGIDWLDTAVSLGGIPADILVGRPVRALQASSSGEYGRATTEMLPNFVENQRKAVQWQLDGVRTRDGRMVMPKEDVDTSSKYLKFFGFQPSQVSDVYAANFAKTRAQSSADNLQRYYVDQYVRLLGAISRSQNPEQTAKLQGEASDLINEVYEQNEKLPPHQRINLNRSTINNAFRREQQGFGSGRGRGASAANSASIDEAFGINND